MGNKIQESWLKIMRSAKTKQLKKDVEIISQNHERDVDRKDAILQMLDRDLDEAEEQHQVAVRSHLLNVDRLLEIQQSRLQALEDDFQKDVATLEEEFRVEREQIMEKHTLEKRELTIIVQQVEQEYDCCLPLGKRFRFSLKDFTSSSPAPVARSVTLKGLIGIAHTATKSGPTKNALLRLCCNRLALH